MFVLQLRGSHSPFRKIGLIVGAAAVIAIAGLGGWREFHSQASPVSATGGIVNPSQIMIDGKELPAQRINDLSVIFE